MGPHNEPIRDPDDDNDMDDILIHEEERFEASLSTAEPDLIDSRPDKQSLLLETGSIAPSEATSTMTSKSRCFPRRRGGSMPKTLDTVTVIPPVEPVPFVVHVEHHEGRRASTKQRNYSQAEDPEPQGHRKSLSTGDLPNAADNQSVYDKDTMLNVDDSTPLGMNLCSSSKSASGGGTTDDDSSVGSAASAAYFEASDFDTSTWTSVLNNASTATLVVMALATAVTHPLLFLAGALTAFGTAKYVFTTPATESAAADAVNGPDKSEEAASTTTGWCGDCCCLYCCCFEAGTHHAAVDEKPMPMDKLCALADDATNADDATETGSADGVAPDIPVVTAAADTTDENGTFVGMSVPGPAVSEQGVVSPVPDVVQARHLSPKDQENWLLRHFPPLKNTVLTNGGPLAGLSVVDFFRVFFDDDAPYSFRAFQEKRGDIDIRYGAWEPLPTVGPISMFSPWHGAFEFPRDIKYRFFQGRRLSFKAKTNSFFGPPHASTTKMQRMLIINKRLAVLENKTTLHDIPFSDRFFVMERWFVRAEKVNGKYVTNVTISCEASFVQSCSFEAQIKAKSTSTISDIVASWCAMATEAIQLTEQAKSNRLLLKQQQERNLNDDEDDESETERHLNDSSMDIPEQDLEGLSSNNAVVPDEVEIVADASFQVDAKGSPGAAETIEEPNVIQSIRSYDEMSTSPDPALPPVSRKQSRRINFGRAK